MLAGATAFLNLYAPQPLLPLFAEAFDASPFAVSLTITAATLAVAVAAPVAGRLADVMGTRQVIVSSSFLLAIATLLAATSSTLSQLVSWRLVQGFLTPGVFAIAMAYIHDEWPASQVGRVTAAYVSGTVVGGFCGRAIAGIVADWAGWPAAFVVLGLCNLATATALWRWLPPGRAPRRLASHSYRGSLVRVLANRQLVATYAVGFCVLFTQTAVFTSMPFHLSAPPFNLGSGALGWLFAVYLLGAAATPIAGRTIDREGHRTGVLLAMSVGAAGSLLTLISSLAAIVVGLALVATSVFFAQITASSHVGAVTTEDRGLSVGIYATCYYLGGSLGAALPVALWAWGGWVAAIGLVLAVQIVIVVLAWTCWRERARPEAPLTVEAGL
jgi:YNFM family putative membrane transporter